MAKVILPGERLTLGDVDIAAVGDRSRENIVQLAWHLLSDLRFTRTQLTVEYYTANNGDVGNAAESTGIQREWNIKSKVTMATRQHAKRRHLRLLHH